MAGRKDIHYLLRPYHMPEEEFEKQKAAYKERGICVAVLAEGEKNMQEGLQRLGLQYIEGTGNDK